MHYQMTGLKMALGGDKACDFIAPDAPFAADPDPEIEAFFGKDSGPYYSWIAAEEGPMAKMALAMPFIEDLIEKQGPFDLICGFSMGGAMATYLTDKMIERADGDESRFEWKGLILVCAVEVEDKWLSKGEDIASVDIPSVHIVGESDVHSPRSMLSYSLFDGMNDKRELFWHRGGHHFPTPFKSDLYNEIADAIRVMLDQ
ncbi:Family of serine hydrolases 3 [Podochytrium sp. JEL0797]|nr:Family of serine hydrolases 3 [Podochytrium sp. JEL0797]